LGGEGQEGTLSSQALKAPPVSERKERLQGKGKGEGKAGGKRLRPKPACGSRPLKAIASKNGRVGKERREEPQAPLDVASGKGRK